MDKQKTIEELAKDLQESWTAWSLSADLPKPWAYVAEILAKKWQPKTSECVVDYIENYKQGFKEGVVAVQTQLEERADRSIMNSDGEVVYLDYDFVTVDDINEICKGLVDE